MLKPVYWENVEARTSAGKIENVAVIMWDWEQKQGIAVLDSQSGRKCNIFLTDYNECDFAIDQGPVVIELPRRGARQTQELPPLPEPEPEIESGVVRYCAHACKYCGRCHKAYCGWRSVPCASVIDAIMCGVPNALELAHTETVVEKPRKKFLGLF